MDQVKVICQDWYGKEAGVDICSLHLNPNDCRSFIREYNRTKPLAYVDDAFFKTSGTPYWCCVTRETRDLIMASNSNGIWVDRTKIGFSKIDP